MRAGRTNADPEDVEYRKHSCADALYLPLRQVVADETNAPNFSLTRLICANLERIDAARGAAQVDGG
ncbi:hypothetical protein QWY75_10630 [Pontixanthobacter aestiaquae]|uniref:hypothetical protein n=1 Tax=Pontixanthobacter aestiaquae TaxID=1509367 RepID=UPI0019296A00|nr:hypothetical protein [Pontixanthobacter aestiaquae]MDN3646654.1 hypothetical protein [Pontixanthobacter aestiaquae]